MAATSAHEARRRQAKLDTRDAVSVIARMEFVHDPAAMSRWERLGVMWACDVIARLSDGEA